jgi:hypothetical protein
VLDLPQAHAIAAGTINTTTTSTTTTTTTTTINASKAEPVAFVRALQRLFAELALSNRSYIDPTPLLQVGDVCCVYGDGVVIRGIVSDVEIR